MNPLVTVAADQRVTSSNARRLSWTQATVWGAIVTAAAVISIAFAYFKIFSVFQGYDDEGFILLSLKSFLAGRPLYDEVYSLFQPAFYVIHGLFFAISGVQVCHDNVRLITIALWIVAGALNGLIAHRLTGSRLLGLMVSIVSVRALEPFANEPGHPQAMAFVLVEAIVALCAFCEAIPPRSLTLALGVLVGLTVLTKINVGVFVALPVTLLVLLGSSGRLAPALKLIISGLMLSLPSLLWHARLGNKGTPLWTLLAFDGLAFVLVVGVAYIDRRAVQRATLALFVAAFTLLQTTEVSVTALPVFNAGLLTLAISTALLICSAQPAGVRPGLLLWRPGGLGLIAVPSVILLIILLQGTTLHGLVTGLFVWPAKVSTGFQIRPRSNALGPLLGLAGALACYGYVVGQARFGARAWFRTLIVSGQIGFGLLVMAEYYFRRPGSSTLIPLHSDLPHFWMLPFAWLVLAREPGQVGAPFGRLALVLIGVMQPLIACPVAGTQLVPASILLIALAAVALGNGLSAVAHCMPRRTVTRWLELSVGLAGAIVLLAPLASETLQLRSSYAALTPLDLPGTSRIRLTADEVHVYHQVVADLAKPEVGTFLTLPGMDSFYLWAQKDPPNGLNVSAWIILLDGEQQERIWQAARKHTGLKVVRNRRLTRSWVGGRSVSQFPLVRHIEEEFVPATTHGDYEVLERRNEE